MTPIEQSIKRLSNSEKPSPIDFFIAWNIDPAIIAERLRRTGFPAEAEQISKILTEGVKNKMDHYLLCVALSEMRNDINKILFSV